MLKNGLKFEGIKHYTIFGHSKSRKVADENTKATLQLVEAIIIPTTLEKDGMQIRNVLCPIPRTRKRVHKSGVVISSIMSSSS